MKFKVIREIFVVNLAFFILAGFIFFLSGCNFQKELPVISEKETVAHDEINLKDEVIDTDLAMPPPEMFLQADEIIPGNHLIIRIGPFKEFPDVKMQTGLMHGLTTSFWENNYVYLMLGISYENRPGDYRLNFEIVESGGEITEFSELIKIGEGNFQFSRFSVPPTVYDSWTRDQLAKDRETVRMARENTGPVPLWDGPFDWPLEGRISSDFGAVRIINEGAPSRHSGIDIAEPEGTPIAAANRGVITLAEFLLASGNAVFIDHGLGLSSVYLHMHEIFVEEGQLVEKGDIIGTVGTTGFSSGSHLHWSIYIGFTPVSPYPFMDGLLPDFPY